jgi:hypothetical protein
VTKKKEKEKKKKRKEKKNIGGTKKISWMIDLGLLVNLFYLKH